MSRGERAAAACAPAAGAAGSAASEQAPDGGHHLFGALVLLGRLGADHACVGVPVEQPERDLVERGLGG